MLATNAGADAQRGVSTTKTTAVGIDAPSESVMMEPEADQAKISIWPGVSRTARRSGGSRAFSSRATTWSNRVANRLSAVRMPPLGPRPYSRMTFL